MGQTGKVLIVDDDAPLRKVVRALFAAEGYEVFLAKDGIEALNLAATQALNVAIVEQLLPRMDGLEVIRRLREIQPRIVPIVLTAHGSFHDAMEAARLGAHDYMTKPWENANLLLAVRLAAEKSRMPGEPTTPTSPEAGRHSVLSIVGESSPMQALREQIRTFAGSDATILIMGESGTGKELAAKAIHYESDRRSNPFVVIDCASIPPALIESELFGYEKGAFTDAHEQHRGKFESADGGSVFLDEIGELHLEAQTKLLRVLQEKEVVRLGGSSPVPVKIRIIAATNRDLEKMVSWDKFRQDLFFRLKVAQLLLPPLRDHMEDIPLYVNHFARKYRTAIGGFVDSVSEETMSWFSSREWPGNVRELENSIIGALANCKGNRLEVSNIRKCAEGNPARERGKGSALPGLLARTEPGPEVREGEIIRQFLDKNRWNLGATAKALDISRRTLYNRMKKFGLK